MLNLFWLCPIPVTIRLGQVTAGESWFERVLMLVLLICCPTSLLSRTVFRHNNLWVQLWCTGAVGTWWSNFVCHNPALNFWPLN
jgi:hypothetical protein